MEKRDKSFLSGFLFVVGAVFILIAGSIFVTTAWKYLPEGGKKFVLLGITVGLLVVSERVLQRGGLERAGTVLFYLGVGFAGFFIISALGGFCWESIGERPQWEMWKLFIAHLVMFFLSALFFVRRTKGVTLGISIILLDGCLLWGSIWASSAYERFGFGKFLLLLAAEQLLFSMGDALEILWEAPMKQEDRRSLRDVFSAFWLLHVVLLFWMTVFEGVVRDFHTGEGFLFTFFLMAASAITYKKRETTLLQVVNSFLLFAMVYVGVQDVLSGWQLSGEAETQWGKAFAAFIINYCIMLRMNRREMRTFLVFGGELLAFSQPFFSVPQQFYGEWSAGLLAFGVVLLGYIWYDKWEGVRWVQFALICQLLLGLLIHDLYVGKLGNVLILGVTGLVILLAASIFRRREYVIASAVLLLLIALYLTRGVWLSIAWWVYLLVAGIVLIVLAIRYEAWG